MPIEHIKREIERFLISTNPEVLCIRGRWGVGKTYAWKRYLASSSSDVRVSKKQYSYVSLFGLNSLDDLRFAIFENTISVADLAAGANPDTFSKLLGKGNEMGRKSKPVVDAISSLLNRKGLSDVFYKTASLAVRNQVVCLDDLERAGKGLDVRDVLGLASFLKEERACQVVLLLNHERLKEVERKEFDSQLEKVADVSLLFDISSSEASEISFGSPTGHMKLVAERVVALGITNIRVIKKIERLALRLVELVGHYRQSTLEQALSTVSLAVWSVLQPDEAPTVDFLRKYNSIAIAMRRKEEATGEQVQWGKLLDSYGYSATDGFDEVIFQGAEAGYFDNDALLREAAALEERADKSAGGATFSKVWEEMYHGSLSVEDGEFLDALYASAVSDAAAITPLNINSAIRLLKECGRADEARKVIQEYIKAHDTEPLEFFSISNHHFSAEDTVDSDLRKAFDRRRKAFVDDRSLLEVVQKVAREETWSEADVLLFAKYKSADYVRLLEELRGKELRRSIEVLQRIARSGDEGATKIDSATTEALVAIGRKSPLRRRKVFRFGVTADQLDAPVRAARPKPRLVPKAARAATSSARVRPLRHRPASGS